MHPIRLKGMHWNARYFIDRFYSFKWTHLNERCALQAYYGFNTLVI